MIILAIIIFFFSLFALSQEDFVFLRKNTSVTSIFDLAVICGLIALFFSRGFFVGMHPSSAYLNPLVFFILPYFPGLSGIGFLLSGFIVVYFITKIKKMPTGRLYDIFALSYLAALTVYLFISSVEQVIHHQILLGVLIGGCSLVAFVFFVIMQKIFAPSVWGDGVIAFLASGLSALLLYIQAWAMLSFHQLPQESVYFLAFFLSLFASFLLRFLRKPGEKHV